MSKLPTGWVKAEFGDVLQYIQRGKSPKYTARSALPVINQKCVRWWGVDERYLKFVDPSQWSSWTKDRYLTPGDILWNSTGTGTIGRAAYFDGLESSPQAVVDSHVTVLRANSAADARFLHRFIQSPNVQSKIQDMQSGTTNQVELNRAEIISTDLPLPPLAEQKRIVAKLDALSAKSARARTELARIEALVSRYKQAVLSKAFSGELTNSQLAQPRVMLRVGDVVSELLQGWSPKCEKLPASSDDQWAVITTTSIQRFLFDPNENKRLPSDLSPRPKLKVRKGDILITRAGPRVRCGVCCYVENSRPNLMLCDKAYKLKLDEIFHPKLFVYLMNSPECLEAIESMKTGGNDSGLNLTQERFRDLSIPYWTTSVQNECIQIIETAFARIDRLAAEAKRALTLVGKLDEAILAKAFRGELVPQDGNDEPASLLLARIRAERAAAPKPKRGRARA